MKKIQIAIADDHEQFRNSIARIINSEVDLEVVIKAKNGVDLLEQLKKVTPDIILMDIQMPEMNGMEASERVKLIDPKVKIIALSQFDNEQNIIEMNIRGVKSFIRKGELEELFKAIRIVYNGGAYMTDLAVQIIQRNLISKPIKQLKPENTLIGLTELEAQVLRCICRGLSSTDIGRIIHKSPRTVEKYREDLYKKFKVTGKKELFEVGHSILYGVGESKRFSL